MENSNESLISFQSFMASENEVVITKLTVDSFVFVFLDCKNTVMLETFQIKSLLNYLQFFPPVLIIFIF